MTNNDVGQGTDEKLVWDKEKEFFPGQLVDSHPVQDACMHIHRAELRTLNEVAASSCT